VIIAIWLNRGHMHGVRMDWRGSPGAASSGVCLAKRFDRSGIRGIGHSFPCGDGRTGIRPCLNIKQWSENHGWTAAFWLRLLFQATTEGLALLMLAAVPSGLYFGFAQGRLMRQHGQGWVSGADSCILISLVVLLLTMNLTDTQQAILAMIAERIGSDGVPPSQAEIARAFGFSGVRAAQYHIEVLEAAGAIRRVPGQAVASVWSMTTPTFPYPKRCCRQRVAASGAGRVAAACRLARTSSPTR